MRLVILEKEANECFTPSISNSTEVEEEQAPEKKEREG